MTSLSERGRTERAGTPLVYLDPDVILSQTGAERIDGESIASGAREQLATLAETGHRLILVTDRPVTVPDHFPKVEHARDLGAGGEAWFLTTDPERCSGRRPGLRSILVGPGPATRMAEIHRCDIRTRDLRSAVIEILSREAMAQTG